ncbi:thiol-disulfide oxidoreductase DCC family protein [Rossellomorea sp. AcN35-11]|nr:thiol-disulfide oxidoreductase DCC family protein [Rossellomorea aquimaris]WJV31593.1 thiol-disulfide oxidoreductase DCC family protein [Rossellomorea sp. AcN35-11]
MGLAVILFDGVCNFCNSSVRFIIDRDPEGIFKFASLQSEIGKQLIKEHGISRNTDSIVLIDGTKAYVESTAALKVCSQLKWPWRIFRVGMVIPKIVRDKGYRWVAKNRYRWFGRQESCMVPPPDSKDRFL